MVYIWNLCFNLSKNVSTRLIKTYPKKYSFVLFFCIFIFYCFQKSMIIYDLVTKNRFYINENFYYEMLSDKYVKKIYFITLFSSIFYEF